MPRSQYETVNEAMGGKLPDVLRKYHARGLSPQAIVLYLHEDHDVTVTSKAMSRWLTKAGVT